MAKLKVDSIFILKKKDISVRRQTYSRVPCLGYNNFR
jgi:hypothetical protein